MKENKNPKQEVSAEICFRHLLQIGLLIQQMNKKYERKLGISLVQWSLLRCLLERPATSPLFLAKEMGITPGALTQSLKIMSRKKFVFICDDPRDARKKIVSLTREGKQFSEKISNLMEGVLGQIIDLEIDLGRISLFLKNSNSA